MVSIIAGILTIAIGLYIGRIGIRIFRQEKFNFLVTMDKNEVAERAVKIILIIAGLSLVFLLVSPFFISPDEGDVLETLMLVPAIPVVMAIVILVALGRSRYDTILPRPLRIVGLILFTLWILSFFINNPFR